MNSNLNPPYGLSQSDNPSGSKGIRRCRMPLRSIIFAVAIIALILAAAVRCEASEWSLQLGYSPQYVAVMNLDEGNENNSWNGFGLQHGGSIAFEWRGKGRWGVQVPVSVHYNKKLTTVSFGAYGVIHFRKQGKRVDPYFMVGGIGQYFKSKDMSSVGPKNIAPMASFGFGARYYVSKHFGFYTEAVMNTIIVINSFQGRAGIAIRF